MRGGISFYTPESDSELVAIEEGDSFTLFDTLEQAQNAGILIDVYFEDMQGVHVNTKVKYQDQQVGVVERIHLNKDGIGLTASIRLTDYGKKFAVEGTKFWLAKAQLRLDRFSEMLAHY